MNLCHTVSLRVPRFLLLTKTLSILNGLHYMHINALTNNTWRHNVRRMTVNELQI